MKYRKTKLSRGETVLSCRLPERKSVAIGVWLRAGGRYETKKNSGISHFLEHLVFKGTRRRSADNIKQAIEGVGGTLNAFTAEEFTCYLAKVAEKHFALALDVLTDLILRPLLRCEDIEKEKGVIIEEIRMYRDQPAHYVHELLSSLLWPNDPLGRPLAGCPESVRRLSRKELIDYRRRLYSAQNVVLSAGGSLDHGYFLKEVERHFKKLDRGTRGHFPKAKKRQKKPQLRVHSQETEQTHLALGIHALSSTHPDRHALNLLSIILGGNMSSRLFDKIREKRGWAYAISSQVIKYRDTGALLISAGVDNRKKLKVLPLILNELVNLRKEPVSRDELRRAKEFYAGQLQLSLEDVGNQMLWMGEREISLGFVPTANEILAEMTRVDEGDILRLSRSLFRESSLSLAIVGPISDKEKKQVSGGLSLQ